MREDLSVSTKVSAVTDGDQGAGSQDPTRQGSGLAVLTLGCGHGGWWGWGEMAEPGSSVYSRVSNPSASDKSSEGPDPTSRQPALRRDHHLPDTPQHVLGLDSANPPNRLGRFYYNFRH